MISEKMKNVIENSSAIRAMFKDGKIMAEKYGKENVFDFSLGNPSIIPPESVKKAVYDILKEESELKVHGYMNNSGFEDVRNIIAENINKKQNTSYNENNIIMTVGAAGGLNVVLKCIINPEDEVIVFAPYFGEYTSYIDNFDGKKVVVFPESDNFQINFKQLESKITSKTKAVIINNPNNPTGIVYSESDIIKLCNILKEKQNRFNTQIYLISDEPYREIIFDDIKIPYLTKYYNNSFVCYSYSKTLSLPGERIGFIVIPNEIEDFEQMIEALSTANRILGFVNAPSLFQLVIAKCINETADLNEYKNNRDILYKALKDYGYECIEPKGAFYMFPKCFIDDDKKFCEIAKEYGIIVVPGSAFDCPGYFRIAYCVNKETILNSLKGFKKLADRFLK